MQFPLKSWVRFSSHQLESRTCSPFLGMLSASAGWDPPSQGADPCPAAPVSFSRSVCRRQQNQSSGRFTSISNTSKTRHCSPVQFSRQRSGLGPGWRFSLYTIQPRRTNPADLCASLSIPGYRLLGCFVKHFKVLWQKEQYKSYLLLTIPVFIEINGFFNYYRRRPYICSTPVCVHKTGLYEICALLTLVKPPH